MGHHIVKIDGKPAFQSDLHPDLPHNHITLDFTDVHSRPALWRFVNTYPDLNLTEDMKVVLTAIESEIGPDLSK